MASRPAALLISVRISPLNPINFLQTHHVHNSFRMNTCKSVSKQRALSPFRMNTYEKRGGGGHILPAKSTFLLPSSPVFPAHSSPLCFQSITNAQFATPLFSKQYKLPGGVPLLSHRSRHERAMSHHEPPFFSITCELLLPQLLCFENDAFSWGVYPPRRTTAIQKSNSNRAGELEARRSYASCELTFRGGHRFSERVSWGAQQQKQFASPQQNVQQSSTLKIA